MTPFSLSSEQLIKEVRTVFEVQSAAIVSHSKQLGDEYLQALALMKNCTGRVIVCGMGKSGHIGRKISASLASLGTPSFFMHPGEAFHGDLGMITKDDLLLLISYSGETDELLKIIPSIQHFGNKIISITGGRNSTLAQHSDVVLDASVEKETCPNNLAPTTSTTLALVIGDALASTLTRDNNFSPMDFARFHPGGSLGKRLLTFVKNEMRSNNLPLVQLETSLTDALMVMTETRTGLALVMKNDELQGVITDGDVRRFLISGKSINACSASELMNGSPCFITPNARLAEAEEIMREKHIKWLIVSEDGKKLDGIIEWVK
ncbi:KpsF/GutQ family sugar-phosphate isomerase [Psychromonas antarctica]|jgi:arabinose-5-phosphate isomerase|uniref:KpsF/GutQ family sugar-phosphate isomerase n=1 Tax=Psychromonas antarctica TaxID=67573 RepID=UPI001EE8001D|nr:KpsF/GutQ family sugar-phosphate isomerase [Psychromonas antarctica]MCG6201013.1 KpsF/GutQ family sugar-phosphate isomerase [Psychromonas antarctica]